MIKFLQILAVNLPLVFDTSGVSLIQSGKDTNLIGAGVTAKTINLHSGGNLYIESLQDREYQKQSSQSAGLQLELGLGGAWSFSLSGSSAKGTARRNQVNEQSGLYAQEGGYHVYADNVHLKGGVIASTNAQNSELATNTFTFEDIQNESASQATSLSGSVGMSRSSDTLYDQNGKVISNPTRAQYADKTLKREKGETGLTGGVGIPLHESQSDSSLTKATLTEGKITLNKDNQPTQTTAKALGINTELKNANEQVENTLNLDRTLQEQNAVQTAVANLQEAAKTYVDNKRQDAQAEFDKVKQQHDKDSETYKTAEAAVKAWEIGGKNKQNIDTVTAVVSTVLAGSPAEQIAVAALSPTLNNQIHALTKDDNSKVTNILAHAVLGAIEAKAAGVNGASGAIAAAGAEIIAHTLAEQLYGVDGKTKTIDDLTQEEKQNILTLSQIGSAIAGGMTADSGYAAGVSGEIGKRAVENNYLSKQDWQNYQSEIRQCGGDRSCVIAVNDKYEKIDQENSKAIEAACKLGGNSESCKARADLAYEGSTYGAKYVYTSNYTGWDNAWLSNRIESSYSDSQLTPSVALLGDETLAKLTALAKDKEFVASLENDKSKQEQFRALVDQSVVAIRTENGAAYEFSGRNLSSPLSELEKITGRYDIYNKETPLEPVIFEDLLVGGGFKLTTEGLSFTTKKLTSAGEKWVSGMATDEMLTLGVAAEIHFSKALEKLLTSSSTAVGNVFKAASDAPMKTTVVNGAATGSAAALGEIYDYTKNNNPKPLTKENIYNSIYTVGIETEKGLLLGNLPLSTSVLSSIAIDKITTGNGNITKNIATGLEGEFIDKYLPKTPSSIFFRESVLKGSELYFDNVSSQERK
ncbi:VENN motif pre-toxin domain-containing protein [Actinobacillus minor]|uniref:VENN motif pre-toxin domain-containing protein n=1 Tax=Actinobacillus minor TaxID=51047 RepID=UPI0026EDC0AF|nr:VENN motif pre-toxin domain-containing protein [Actinobacillus minor]